jgi:hypothetical protein
MKATLCESRRRSAARNRDWTGTRGSAMGSALRMGKIWARGEISRDSRALGVYWALGRPCYAASGGSSHCLPRLVRPLSTLHSVLSILPTGTAHTRRHTHGSKFH